MTQSFVSPSHIIVCYSQALLVWLILPFQVVTDLKIGPFAHHHIFTSFNCSSKEQRALIVLKSASSCSDEMATCHPSTEYSTSQPRLSHIFHVREDHVLASVEQHAFLYRNTRSQQLMTLKCPLKSFGYDSRVSWISVKTSLRTF